jgi:hypothetical protein
MKIELRKGDLDASRRETAMDLGMQIVDSLQPILHVRKESSQDDIQGTVGKLLEGRHRLGVLHDTWVIGRNLQQDPPGACSPPGPAGL